MLHGLRSNIMIDRVPFKDTKLSRLGLGAMRLPVKTKIKRK